MTDILKQHIMINDLLVKKGIITNEERENAISFLHPDSKNPKEGEVQSEEEQDPTIDGETSGQAICREADTVTDDESNNDADAGI